MAKGKSGILGTGAFRQPHMKADDLPWGDIETSVGVTFDTRARREIFHCFVAYHAHLSVEQSRVAPDEVDALRRTILTCAQNLIDVLEHFRSPSGGAPSDADEALFSTLALSSTHPDFDLTTLLRQLDQPCRELLAGLSDQTIAPNIVHTIPEATALAAFFKETRKGARSKAARASHNFTATPTALEFRRWGVALGPKSSMTARFATAVLGRPVSISQVAHALASA